MSGLTSFSLQYRARVAENRQGTREASQVLASSKNLPVLVSGERLPLPIIFKAAFGGGGRGMRRPAEVFPVHGH